MLEIFIFMALSFVTDQKCLLHGNALDICDRLWENRPLRALLQNRVIGIQG